MLGVHLQRVLGEVSQLGQQLNSPLAGEALTALRAVARVEDEGRQDAIAHEVEEDLRKVARRVGRLAV
jgi:hypothetical protein